jgi:hypothetical protein
MGLDMYLTGSKFFPNFKVERPVDIDGDQIQLLEVSLGYWRKFGPLHAYIVDTFADGVDECQRIDLEEADLVAIAEAIMFEKLAKDEDSTGCFFGSPEMWAEDRADKAKHAATFVAASEWLRKQPESAVALSLLSSKHGRREPMRLELKSIKYAKFMSQETACYEGKIYVDGKFFATAINEGQGGPDAYHRNLNYKGDWNAKFKEIDAFFARLPKLDSEYFPDGMEQTLELWCGKQLDRHLAKRDLYRLFKTKILYTEDGSTMYTTGFENNARIKVREPSAHDPKRPAF